MVLVSGRTHSLPENHLRSFSCPSKWKEEKACRSSWPARPWLGGIVWGPAWRLPAFVPFLLLTETACLDGPSLEPVLNAILY